jgi:hypothetical protein
MAPCSQRVNPPFFEVNDAPRAPEKAPVTSAQKARLHCTAQSFLLVRDWNISRMGVINQSTMYGWDMSAIQIVGFGLAIFWAASFVFSGYLLLPRRSELDQSNWSAIHAMSQIHPSVLARIAVR